MLSLVCAGLTNRESAQRLAINTSTAETHVLRIMTMPGTGNRVQTVLHALKNGLVAGPFRVFEVERAP